MAAPILTAEQRREVFADAQMAVGDNHDPVFQPGYDEAKRREHVAELKDAISTLDAIGWNPADQDEPLTELGEADREAVARFAATMRKKWQECVDSYEADAASPRRSVAAAQALEAAVAA